MDQLSQVAASFGMFLPGLLDSVNCVCSCVCASVCICVWMEIMAGATGRLSDQMGLSCQLWES